MTELGYRPDQQTPPGVAGERFVFVDPQDSHGREFEIRHEQVSPPGAAIEQETQAVHDAYEQQVLDRQRAAAEQREARADAEQLRYSIECDTVAMANIQDYTANYGLDPAHEGLARDRLELAA